MKVRYCADTDSLQIAFCARDIVESEDLDTNTVLDLDADGNICALTFEHARRRTDMEHVRLETIAARCPVSSHATA